MIPSRLAVMYKYFDRVKVVVKDKYTQKERETTLLYSKHTPLLLTTNREQCEIRYEKERNTVV